MRNVWGSWIRIREAEELFSGDPDVSFAEFDPLYVPSGELKLVTKIPATYDIQMKTTVEKQLTFESNNTYGSRRISPFNIVRTTR